MVTEAMEGLIYKVQPYSEHARLLFVYTPIGKKTLLAQGSQKINHPHRILAQYLTRIEFKDQDKTFLTLSEPRLIDDYGKLKTDFLKTKSAAVILEIIDHFMVESMPHDDIYQEAIDALQSKQIHEASLSFSIKMLKPLGFSIHLHPDGREVAGIGISRGGIVYRDEDHPIDLETKDATSLLKLAAIPYMDLMPIDPNELGRLKTFVLKYYEYHLQTTLKNLQ